MQLIFTPLHAFHCTCVLLTLRKYLQNWGDFADMNQGVAIYVMFTGDVLLICWLGTQLTQHVREEDV